MQVLLLIVHVNDCPRYKNYIWGFSCNNGTNVPSTSFLMWRCEAESKYRYMRLCINYWNNMRLYNACAYIYHWTGIYFTTGKRRESIYWLHCLLDLWIILSMLSIEMLWKRILEKLLNSLCKKYCSNNSKCYLSVYLWMYVSAIDIYSLDRTTLDNFIPIKNVQCLAHFLLWWYLFPYCTPPQLGYILHVCTSSRAYIHDLYWIWAKLQGSFVHSATLVYKM